MSEVQDKAQDQELDNVELDQDEGETQKETDSGGLLDANSPAIKDGYEEGVKPDGLDDALWDEENKTFKAGELYEAFKKSEKRVADMRSKMGKNGDVPKEASEYTIEFENEDLKDLVQDGDVVVEAAKEAALKAGISKEAFQNFMAPVIEALSKIQEEGPESHMTEDEINAKREEEYAKLGKNGKAVARATVNWANSLRQQGILSEDELKTLGGWGRTADGVRILNKLRSLNGEPEIPLDAPGDDGLPSDKEIGAMIASKEYQAGEATIHAKVDKYLSLRQQAGRPMRLQL